MDWRLKFIITWIILSLFFRLCAGVGFVFGDHNYNWRFYKDNSFFGVAYQFIWWGGLICIGGHGLYHLGNWWINF